MICSRHWIHHSTCILVASFFHYIFGLQHLRFNSMDMYRVDRKCALCTAHVAIYICETGFQMKMATFPMLSVLFSVHEKWFCQKWQPFLFYVSNHEEGCKRMQRKATIAVSPVGHRAAEHTMGRLMLYDRLAKLKVAQAGGKKKWKTLVSIGK